ncbi:hypothetical protein ASG87_12410 [Frateuria sp. Soil773]|uniref:winged helix-turn-helix domain-containing protein n=1 Tax=Frateuria sp. Soil773 TaxID=1736407 RepID=UPI0006FA3B41|nr:winged helix-turn-helix domain-containing protein [Frateuria sp. Soil773]KRF01202.1 hypothetical protein ASG87_12410 [Frateuria sp. Soil773]
MDKSSGQVVSICFDNVRIDPQRHALYVSDRAVHLEPKAFAVLWLLASRANQIVGRDEILDTVWKHRHVTPAVLSRVIVVLRRSLGEGGRKSQLIRTIHGVGYRLDIPADAGGPSPTAAAEEAMPQATALPAPPLVRPAPAWRWRGARMAGASVLAGLIALGGWFLVPRPPAITEPRVALAILPLRTDTDNAELRMRTEAFTDSLIEGLAAVPALKVASRDAVLALGRSATDMRQTAVRLNADYVLAGQVVPAGKELRLHAELWRSDRPAPVWVFDRDTSQAGLYALEGPLMERVHSTLTSAGSDPVRSTVSDAAQRLYWIGRHYWYQRTPESLVQALDYFQRAIAEDPHFALAYCGLSDTYMLLYLYADLTLDEAASKAEAALAKARAADPGLVDILVSESEVLNETGRPRQAIATVEKALRASPRHPLAILWYGYYLEGMGRIRDAVDWYRHFEGEPGNAAYFANFGSALTMMGMRTEAETALRRAIELNPEHASIYWDLALFYRMHGDFDRAMAVYADEQRRPDHNGWTPIMVAHTWLQRGDGAKALASLQGKAGLSAIDRLEVQTRAWCLLGRCDKAQQLVDGFGFDPGDKENYETIRAWVYLLTGRPNDARQVYATLFSSPERDIRRFMRLWKSDLNLSVYSGWVAAQPAASPERAASLRAFGNLLDRLDEGGLKLPLMSYERSVQAALDGRASDAGKLLRSAMDAGWVDLGTLDLDPAWVPYRSEAWFRALRERIDIRSQMAKPPELAGIGREPSAAAKDRLRR